MPKRKAAEAATNAMKKSKTVEEAFGCSWSQPDETLYVFNGSSLAGASQIAAFDLVKNKNTFKMMMMTVTFQNEKKKKKRSMLLRNLTTKTLICFSVLKGFDFDCSEIECKISNW
jgi:hypothetical protein